MDLMQQIYTILLVRALIVLMSFMNVGGKTLRIRFLIVIIYLKVRTAAK